MKKICYFLSRRGSGPQEWHSDMSLPSTRKSHFTASSCIRGPLATKTRQKLLTFCYMLAPDTFTAQCPTMPSICLPTTDPYASAATINGWAHPWIQCKTNIVAFKPSYSGRACQAELVSASSIVRPTRAISAEGHVSQTSSIRFWLPLPPSRENVEELEKQEFRRSSDTSRSPVEVKFCVTTHVQHSVELL